MCQTDLGLPSRVSPFGNLRIEGYYTPPRSLSQLRHVLHRYFVSRHPPYALTSHPASGMHYAKKRTIKELMLCIFTCMFFNFLRLERRKLICVIFLFLRKRKCYPYFVFNLRSHLSGTKKPLLRAAADMRKFRRLISRLVFVSFYSLRRNYRLG